MSDLDAKHAQLWLDYQDGRLTAAQWQILLETEVGLRRFVRRAREHEMLKQKREAHRLAGWR